MKVQLLTFLIGLLGSYSCHGQIESEGVLIEQFKNDFLVKERMYKPDTIHTSEAMLTRERLPNVRCITIYPVNQNIKHVEYYYNDTNILESTYSYTLPHENLTGITKHFNKKGELEYIQDHDKGTWEVVKFDHYPYYKTLVKMKGIVDSLIIATYGEKFYNDFVLWSPEGSAYYDGKYAGATWYDYQEWEPKEFLLRYSLKLAEDEKYEEQFEVHLDSAGQIIFPFNDYKDIRGFEKPDAVNGFVLSKQIAIDKAKQLGLIETDTTKAFAFLDWEFESVPKFDIFNGRFTYNVAINTKVINHEPIGDRRRMEYKFDIYIFNPWTSQFIEKRKMKSYKEWEANSGHTTRLMPDK